MIERRQFIVGLGSAAAWPAVAHTQQGNRVRRIGALIGTDETDPLGKPRLAAFTQALTDLGWTDGRNIRIELRWGSGDNNRIRPLAQELVDFQPDVILTGGTPATAAFQRETHGSTARVGTSPALPTWNRRWEASGLNCFRRSRPGSTGSQSCSIPTLLLCRPICPHLKRRPGH